MRALIVALAIASVAGAASAGGAPGLAMGQGDTVPQAAPTPRVPDGVREQAEAAVRHDVGDGATFRALRVMEAATVRHGPFAERIDGPVSVICGQYASPDRPGGDASYAWFFVAIKRGQVLWTAADKATEDFDEAYNSCKAAGLTHDTLTQLGGSRN